MTLVIPELMFGDVNMISIPTDAILIVSLLIVFLLLGYFFNNILKNNTNEFAHKINENSNIELMKETLEDQIIVKTTSVEEKNLKASRIKTLNILKPRKLLKLSSLALISIGGVSLLGLHSLQKSYEGVSSSRVPIELENQSTKFELSLFDLKPFHTTQQNIKKIQYIDPFLSTIKSSKNNRDYKVEEKQIENNFSF